jgi:hypothetical protein
MTNFHTKVPTLLVIHLVIGDENSMGAMALKYSVILLHERKHSHYQSGRITG